MREDCQAGALLVMRMLANSVSGQVDRRYNRARYDAAVALTAFAAGLKDAVDLDSIRDDLATIVHQALEPALSRCASVSERGSPLPRRHLGRACLWSCVPLAMLSPLGRRWPPALWLPGGKCGGRVLWAHGGPRPRAGSGHAAAR